MKNLFFFREMKELRGNPITMKVFTFISIFFFILLFNSSLVLALPQPILQSNVGLQRTILSYETDYNSDGLPDVYTTFNQLNDTMIEINAYQTNPNTKGGSAYKWQSAIFNIEGLTSVQKLEYNPATQVWSNTGNLVPYDYRWTTGWNVSGNTVGYSLFGSGSGNKTYRLILPPGNKTFKVFTGSSSEQVLYQWVNNSFYIYPSTQYDREPFAISIYDCNGNLYEYPNINWTDAPESTDNKIIFYPQVAIAQTNCIRFRTNTLESQPLVIQTANQFQGEIKTIYHLSFEDFEAKNNITSRNITIIKPTLLESFFDTFPFIWRMFSYQADTNYYDIEYRGIITDLDPSLELTLNTAYPDAITFNQTEGSSLGARLSAAVLSMDFNTPGENLLNLPYQNSS